MSLEQRLAELEKRVQCLEDELSDYKSTQKTALPAKPVETPAYIKNNARYTADQIAPIDLQKEKVDYEKLLTQIWLPRIFIFVLLIGLIWGFKAASDYGFINPAVKAGLGFAISALMVWLGYRQFNHQREKLGQVLLGGAICLLMLTTFAMANLYGLISSKPAFALNAAWIMAGIYFTHKFRSEALGILSVIGGFLVPFLIGSKTGNVYSFTAYETILYLTFLFLSIRNKYVKLYFTSAILLNAVLVVYSALAPFAEKNEQVLTCAIIIQHVFLIAAFISRSDFMKQQAGTLFASFAITYAWVDSGFNQGRITVFLSLSIALYILIALYSYRTESKERGSVSSSILLLAILFFIFHLINEKYVGLLLIVEGFMAIYLGMKLKARLQQITGFMVYFLGTALTVITVIDRVLSIATLSWLIFFIASIFLCAISIKTYPFKNDDKRVVTLTVSLVLTLLGLYFMTQETLAATRSFTINAQHLILSFIWCLYSITAIVYGIFRSSKTARYTGIGLLLLTLLKLIFFDIPSVSILVRAILFMGLGSIGLIISRLFYKK